MSQEKSAADVKLQQQHQHHHQQQLQQHHHQQPQQQQRSRKSSASSSIAKTDTRTKKFQNGEFLNLAVKQESNILLIL